MIIPRGSKVYIAGPMRKHRDDNYNFKNFFYWQVVLEKSGYAVINPAALDCKKALYSEWYFTESQYDEILDMDLAIIDAQADVLFMLDGWEDSEGAFNEILEAQHKGIPVCYQPKDHGGKIVLVS